MIRRVMPILLVLLVQATCMPRTAEAHIPPPAYLNMTVDDQRVEVLVVVSFDVVRGWFGVDPDQIPEDGAVTGDVRVALEQGLTEWLHVQVDGRPVAGALEDARPERFEDHLQMWAYVNVRVRFPTSVPARQVAVAWTQYATAAGWAFVSIDAELFAYSETVYPVFKEREPEYTWHRPRDIAEPAAPVVLPEPVKAPHVGLPLVSLALVLGFLGFAVLGRVRGRRWALVVPVLLAAVLLSGVAQLDVPVPWDETPARPPDDEALSIFASLHRGVYTAVGGETEDEIYDDLDECVTGDLLERLYLDIHQSLILQQEGGAVAKIHKTEIAEAEIIPAESGAGAWFMVKAAWIVEGKVGHWGHTHQRINEYDAVVTVVATEGRWKIAEIEVLDERRIDDGKKVR